MNDLLEKLREIRCQENINLKPSPYLKPFYTDYDGEEKSIILRNYQKQMILNLLNTTRFLNSEDTGLGKTIELLTTIGYIWLKEPEYIPIILAKKSALFQWENECLKFMQGMNPVVVHGEPFERHKIYEEFFNNYNINVKKILILTYDTLVRDMTESVVRSRETQSPPILKKEFKLTRKKMILAKEEIEKFKPDFHIRFNARSQDIQSYVASRLQEEKQNVPYDWTQEDEISLTKAISFRDKYRKLELEVNRIKDILEPPKIVYGINFHIDEFLTKHPNAKFLLVMDEMHIVKNYKSRFHEHVANLSKKCSRVYGLTATPVKNRLMEFFSLFRIISPGLFPKVTHFMNEYCITKLQPIRGGRKIPIVVGYKNLDRFIEKIEPYYLGRRKHEVAKELPELITRELPCELYELQEELYDLAENGLLETSENPDAEHADILKAMTLVQQAVDSPKLIADAETDVPYDGPSSKLDTLLEMFEDELNEVKVIIFSKFEKMISLVEGELKKNKIECVRITGTETASMREKAKNVFQDMNSGVNVILVTTAGSESINLQSAEHFVLLDSPWSWGDYVQLIGRMLRIGSIHTMVIVTHLIAIRRGGGKTIDQHVIKTLKGKKLLSDKVSGEAIKDGLQFVQSQETMDLFRMIKDGNIEREEAVKQVSALKTPKKKILKIKSKSNSKKPMNVNFPDTISFDDI